MAECMTNGISKQDNLLDEAFCQHTKDYIKLFSEFRSSNPQRSDQLLKLLDGVVTEITLLLKDFEEHDSDSESLSVSSNDGEYEMATKVAEKCLLESDGYSDYEESSPNETLATKSARYISMKSEKQSKNNPEKENSVKLPEPVLRLPGTYYNSFLPYTQQFNQNTQSMYNSVPGMKEIRHPPFPPPNIIRASPRPVNLQHMTIRPVQHMVAHRNMPPNFQMIPTNQGPPPQQRLVAPTNNQPPGRFVGNAKNLPKVVLGYVQSFTRKVLLEKVKIGQEVIVATKNLDSKLENLTEIIRNVYPNARLYQFGSRITGLGSPNSDLDIFIDIDNEYNQKANLSKRQLLAIQDNLFYILNKEFKDSCKLEVIREARTPLIMFDYMGCFPKIDFSFTNGLSHSNTRLVKYFMDLQPGVLETTISIKHWFKVAGLYQKGFNSYCAVLMVIFYFQTKSVLPSVVTLQETIQPEEITGWQTNFACKSRQELNLKTLDFEDTVGFFQFYANFNFDAFAVCPLTGTVVQKSIFDVRPLPPVFNRLENYLASLDGKSKTSSHMHERFLHNNPMCVQDPLDLAHNVTRRVADKTVAIFKAFCKDTVAALLMNRHSQ